MGLLKEDKIQFNRTTRSISGNYVQNEIGSAATEFMDGPGEGIYAELLLRNPAPSGNAYNEYVRVINDIIPNEGLEQFVKRLTQSPTGESTLLQQINRLVSLEPSVKYDEMPQKLPDRGYDYNPEMMSRRGLGAAADKLRGQVPLNHFRKLAQFFYYNERGNNNSACVTINAPAGLITASAAGTQGVLERYWSMAETYQFIIDNHERIHRKIIRDQKISDEDLNC